MSSDKRIVSWAAYSIFEPVVELVEPQALGALRENLGITLTEHILDSPITRSHDVFRMAWRDLKATAHLNQEQVAGQMLEERGDFEEDELGDVPLVWRAELGGCFLQRLAYTGRQRETFVC